MPEKRTLSTEELRSKLKQHETYLRTDGNRGERLNLIHYDLAGHDFSGTILDYADFSNSNLRGVNFSGARLRNARFVKADLSDANLFNANLMDAVLSHAVLHRANLTNATLTGANLSYADMSDALLPHAVLYKARIDHTNLHHADMEHTDFSYARMVDSDLTDADLWHAHNLPVQAMIRAGINLNGARLPNGKIYASLEATPDITDPAPVRDIKFTDVIHPSGTEAQGRGAAAR